MLGPAFKSVLTPIHRAGWPFIAIFFIGALVLFNFGQFPGLTGLVLTAWCVYFFRDPERVTPTRPGLVISPADGQIQMITQVVPPADLLMGTQPLTRISIFLNVFNVHVNRIPVDGTIDRIAYHPGKFLNAALDKASEENERNSLRIRLSNGQHLGVVQIAGWIARRILCDAKDGQTVKAGERYGIIRFGSRTDIYLPAGTVPLACIGQTAVGGETVLADLQNAEPPRAGETR